MNSQKEIIIDLTRQKKQLNESFLRQFGAAIEMILKRMFGLNSLNFKVRGPRADVRDFIKAVASESSYMSAIRKHGLSDPKTFSSRADLERAIGKFELSTGIKWPLR